MLATALLATLVACKPNDGNQGDSGNDPGNSGSIWDPGQGGWNPDPGTSGGGDEPGPITSTLSPMDMLTKIIESVEMPEQALNLDVSAKAETDNKLTTLNLKANFYNKVRNELCFAVYQQQKKEADSQRQLVFAVYIVNDKIYLDMADGSPLIYLSDFDFNYLVQLIQGAGGMVGDLIGSLDSGVMGIIDLVIGFLLGTPEVTVNADKSQSMKMELRLKNILGSAGTLLGFLPFDIPIDLGPLITYLNNLIPDDTLYINAKFKNDGVLENVGVSGVDKGTNKETFDFSVSIDVRDKADADIGFPSDLADRMETTVTEFSFTNLQFSIDLIVDSVKDENGQSKNFDIGRLINGFLGASSTMMIPDGLLLLNGGTGVRLSFKLDLDLNYDKLPQDNNKIAIELFLINTDGTLAEVEPQLGIYYKEGSFYLNTDNMLPNYLNGLNLKLDASLNDLVSKLVDLVSDAIDGVFGLDFAGLRKEELTVNNDGSLNLSSMSAVQKVMANSNASVIALASEDDGSYKLAAGIGSFVDMVANLLGMGKVVENGVVKQEPNIYTDDTSIKVVVNDNFFSILGGLIPALKEISLPKEIGDIVLSINTYEKGIESVTIETTLNNTAEIVGKDDKTIIITDPAVAIKLSLGEFFIGLKDEDLPDYIDSKVKLDSTNYLTSLNGVIEHLLGGIRFSSGFSLKFDAGTYDLAPFIAGFGVSEVENSSILWTFDNDFILDASLNLQIALNRVNTAESMIVLEMKTESGIRVGNHQIIEPDKVLLGIYGYNNNIYIDISNFNIAGIVLPKLSFSLNFTDLLYSLLDNVIGGLLNQIGVQGGDLKFELDFKELLGFTSQVVAQSASSSSMSTSGVATYAQAREVAPAEAIILWFNTDKFVPSISLAAILALLSATKTELGNTLAEALSLMKVDLSLELGRKDGFIFTFTGDFIPKVDENGEAVYYFDDKDQRIVKEEGKIYRNIKDKPENEENINPNVVYYTRKEYNYGSNMELVFAAGTAEHPVIVGNLGEHKYPIKEKAQEFDDYKSDLIDAILTTVGKASVLLDIDLYTLDNEMNLTRLINNVLANAGKKLDLPMSLDLDDWSTHVQLALSWDLDLTRFSNSKISLELKYEQKNILGLYIYRNSIIVDLTGLGLFSGEIVNSTIVTKVFSMVDGLIRNIGNFDLNDIINDLLKNAGLPTVGASPEGTDQLALSEEVAADSGVAMIGENLELKDFIKYLTEAIHLENTAIVINFTSAIINGMLEELVGVNLGINLGLDGKLDLFGDRFELGFTVEDITMDLALSLSLGRDVEIPVDFDDVPDWDATNGERFVTTLLNNLDIGFTIDLANYTNDVVNLHGQTGYGYIDDYKLYTRIIIEKVTASAGKKLEGVKGTPVAPQGSFLITLGHINKTMYNDNQASGKDMKALVYLVLDHRKTSGQMMLAICSNLVNFVVDIGEAVGLQYIDLDLVGMLAPVIDNLFSSIDGMLSGNNTESQTLAAGEPTTYAEPAAADEPTGIAKVFAELDIIKLLGERGIMLNLRANGTFNVTIEFDPYLINKLIDDILGYVFAKNSGHESIINLKEMAPDMFSKSYLDLISWTRETYGANKKNNTFWGDLQGNLTDMLKDVAKGAIGGVGGSLASLAITDALLNSVYNQVRNIVSGLLPFAVWNTATLEVNIVDATISNIHFRGQDNGEHIYVDNDPTKPIAYDKSKDARGYWKDESSAKAGNPIGFFTEIFIYNSSKSVGESTADGANNGLVTWADIPTSIPFIPYVYSSYDDGVDEIIKMHFTDKIAIYQKGTTIMRANVTFKIESGNKVMGPANLKAALQNPKVPDDGGRPYVKVIATASFSNNVTKTLPILIYPESESGSLVSIDDIEMHAYDDSLPDFLVVHTESDKLIKINTEYMSFGDWRPQDYEAHDVETTVSFKNGTTLPLTIHYLDSTVNKIIIDGSEGTNINVDLYEFNINPNTETKTSTIEDFTPETLFFKYPDGKAVGLDVLNGWNTTEATENLFGRVLDSGKYSTNVSGGKFTITTTIAAFDGSAPQTVELTFVVNSKEVYSLTINDAVNTINIDPYKYYMYMIGGGEENPFPSVVEANYLDSNTKQEYDEDVHVVWKNLENVVFDWNNNNDKVNPVDVALDNSAYPNSSFTWTFKKTNVAVMRNEVEAIYFDEALKQSALFIDPFQYFVNDEGVKYFPDHAYVQFTNGAVYDMPIAWKELSDDNFVIDPERPAQFRQFDVVIGFDPYIYKQTGQIVEYSKINGTLLQEKYVNVQVEDRVPLGIEVDGSELKGGTYYIDPIQVLYYGMNPFPSRVTVKYTNGKTSVLKVKDSLWIRNFEITMKGKKNLKATLRLSDKYSFDINVEIIDRSSIKSELTNMAIDPYIYKMDEKGNRLYDVYVDNVNLYQTVGSLDLETFEIIGTLPTCSGEVTKEYGNFLKYVIEYTKDGEPATYVSDDIDYVKDFVARNKESIVSTQVRQCFNVPITWDLTEINYSISDTYTVKTKVQAKNELFNVSALNKPFKVDVEVRAKRVKGIFNNEVLYIMVGGTNLSETAKMTQKLTLTKNIVFDDDSMGQYEVTIDLTKINYMDSNRATIRSGKDADGNIIYTDLRVNVGSVVDLDQAVDCAMDIEVTVCSGDIAQTCIMKVHVMVEDDGTN
ncbi:MAG: hypothetical protein K2I23_04560 [Clostridia bacterium]|nr:hypothetical protein [Clostridia bacterium]